MKCNHCGSEWQTTLNNQNTLSTCPFCGRSLKESATVNQPEKSGNFIIVNDTVIQFLGGTKEAVIPAGVVRIGSGAFHGYNVESVYIPDGVTTIGDNCFNDCKQLKWVRIPTSVTSISDSAFRDAGNVKIRAEQGSYAWNKYAKAASVTKAAPAVDAEPAKPVVKEPAKPVAKETAVQQVERPVEKPAPARVAFETPKEPSYSFQSNVAEWARLLNCEPGEQPWTVKHNVFGRVDRLISRINAVHDQALLTRIVKEAPRADVRWAAVKNLREQSVLVWVLLNDPNASVRYAALPYIEDEDVLRKVAKTDAHSQIRNQAFFRFASAQEVKEYLMNNEFNENALSRIVKVEDLQDLAIRAKNTQVRYEAAEKLPDESAEKNFLSLAAALSDKIKPLDAVYIDRAYSDLKDKNPAFLKKVADCYPDPLVRYVARGKKEVSAVGASAEERLSSSTPSLEEVKRQEEFRLYLRWSYSAREDARRFNIFCQNQASKGEHYAVEKYRIDADGYENALKYQELLEDALKQASFKNFYVSLESEGTTRWNRETFADEPILAYFCKVSTRW